MTSLAVENWAACTSEYLRELVVQGLNSGCGRALTPEVEAELKERTLSSLRSSQPSSAPSSPLTIDRWAAPVRGTRCCFKIMRGLCVRWRTDDSLAPVHSPKKKGSFMAIHHASSGEAIDIRPYGGTIGNALTKTLYKTRHLEVFRVVLLAGKSMPEHKVNGELTVQCLEGCVEFSVEGVGERMRPGDLKCLAGGVLHGLKAVEDCSVLITLLLHGA